MTSHCSWLILVVAVGILTSGCKTHKESRSESSRRPARLTSANAPAKLGTARDEDSAERRAESLARYAAGVSHELNSQLDLALEEYYKSALTNSDNQAFVLETAERLLRENKAANSVQLLSIAVKRPNASATTHALLARAYLQAGQTNQAIAACQTALKKTPDSLNGYQTLAEVCLQLGQTDEGIKALSALTTPANEGFMLETAQKLMRDNKTPQAINLLSNSVKRVDASGSAYALLAWAYVQSGETNYAVPACQTALKKMPNSLPGYQTLVDVCLQLGRNEDGIKVLRQAIKQPKVDAVFLIGLAEMAAKYLQLQPKEIETIKPIALDALQRAGELKPKSPALLQRFGDVFSQFGERTKAAEVYLQLLDKYSDLPLYRDMLREKLANIYLMDNDKGQAAEQLEAMIRDNPARYPQAYYVLGTLAFEKKNYEKAADYFGKAVLISPDLEQGYYELAGAQISLDQPAEALITLEKARAKFSQNFLGEFYSALAAQKLKNYAQALKHYTAAEVIASATDPKRLNYLFYFQFGSCRERNREYEQAEKYFQKSLELKPDEPETLNYLGYMWADRSTNLDKARDMIERALKLDPKNPAYLDSMGWVLFKLNQPEQALPYLIEAAELSREPDPTVHDHIGDVYHALKQHEKAREAWQKSLQIEINEEVKKKLGFSL